MIIFFRRADDILTDDDAVTKVKVNQVGASEDEDLKIYHSDSFTETPDYTYEDYADIVDRLNFGIFTLITNGATLGFMFYIATGDTF